MTNTIQALLEKRTSVNVFDANRPISDARIEELTALATLSPSAFNFQNWRFIAVRSDDGRKRLRAVANDQAKVTEAPVTFIVCGTLQPHEGLATTLHPSVGAGILSQEMFEGWAGFAKSMYADAPALQRDEAIRSASFAAMTLMLAATDAGLASGPMIGFDPAGVAREFQLSENEFPVLLLAVGYAAPENWPQKPRLPVAKVLSLV